MRFEIIVELVMIKICVVDLSRIKHVTFGVYNAHESSECIRVRRKESSIIALRFGSKKLSTLIMIKY
jgi:hypothetical protein